MAQPSAYNRAYNFSNFQAANPDKPLPASSLDEELSRVKAVFDQIRSNLVLIQRDDTALANDSVGFDQLKAEIQIGINPPTAWATDKNYVARDTVFTNSNFYICEESHVSGTFATDLAAGKWTKIASFEAATSAESVTFDDSDADLSANTVQLAIEALKTLIDTLTTNVGALDGADITFTSTGMYHTDADDVQAALSDHDAAISAQGVPTGTVLDTARSSAPSGYLMCYGQAVSRTTYSDLFTAIGETYGEGDGSTTFNVPDLRGRVAAGKDDMGGTSANRLTNQSGGVNGDTLGGTGGSETHTLAEAELPSHTHGAGTLEAASAGAHTHTVPISDVSNVGGGGASRMAAGGSINTGSSGAHTHTVTGSTASSGSGDAHNNVQPTIVFNKIIKT